MNDDLERRLTGIVRDWRMPIDAPCRALLAEFVAMGIARLDAEPANADDPSVASDNLRRLLDDMTQQVRILRFDAINRLTFASAVERLCPLWPFC